MPIQTSPSVAVTEKDYSQVVTFAPSGEGAIAGVFTTGPILLPVLIGSVADLETTFGTPTEANYRAWFTAYNFLQYSNKLWIIRVEPANGNNAVPAPAAGVLRGNWSAVTSYVLNDIVIGSNGKTYIAGVTDTDPGDDPIVPGPNGLSNNSWAELGIKINNSEVYSVTSQSTLAAAGQWICKQPGAIGNNLEVITLDAGNWAAFITAAKTSEGRLLSDYIIAGEPTTTSFVENKYGVGKKDEIHVLVIDKTGIITGTAGRILEIHQGLSKATDALDYQGRNIYYASFINNYSSWLYWGSAPSNLSAVAGEVNFGSVSSLVAASGIAFKSMTSLQVQGFIGGNAGALAVGTSLDSALITAYNLLSDKEGINVTFVMTSDYPVAVQRHVVQSVVEPRRDCIAFVSPHNNGEPFVNKTTILTDLLTFRNTTLNINSSFAVLDSGYKYQFDGYNQQYRWVPLNGDIAGLCARLDVEYEAWQSPAGFTRGIVKNVGKLSSVLTQAHRDQLYPKGMNAVVSFSGKGTVLFGDRTMQSKSSAFQSIHIRRLFIILEKAIEEAAKFSLFELNNEITRNNFNAMVTGFLASIKARDGLDDFVVISDKSNNSDDSIARGEFIADIYIKPLYSIQFVVLNFVAVKSTVQFNQSVQ